MDGNATRRTDGLLRLAVQHHDAGQTERAERFYREILRIDPTHGDAAHLLGHIAYQTGRRRDAARLFDVAVRSNATVGSYHLALGQALLAEGRNAEAFASSRRALALDPGDADAFCLLGGIAGRLGRGQLAVRCFQRAARVAPRSAQAQLGLGRALEALSRPDGALKCYRLAVRLCPTDVGAWIALANAYRRWNAPVEAVAAYAEALRLDERNASVWANMGAALQTLGRDGQAGQAYARALVLRPDDGETRNNLGLLHHSLGNHAAAYMCFTVALALDPANVPALVNMGLAEMAIGRPDRAVASQIRALNRQRGCAEAWNNLGNAYRQQGIRTAAEDCWRNALAINPQFSDALGNMATALSERERFDEAEALLRRALRLMPTHAALHAALGHMLASAQRPADAAAACRRSLALAPALADPLCTLGLMKQRMDDESAGAWLDRAVAVQPSHALARFNRGLLALERGSLVEGWRDYAFRFKAGRARPHRRFSVPEWTGQPLDGKRLFVWREQGVGDELLFASCYPDLLRRAGHLVVECDRRLVSLFARSLPGASVRAEQPTGDSADCEIVDCDYHIPAGSLPRLLRDTLPAFPPRSVWLHADACRVLDWRDRLDAAGSGLRVGISWRSAVTTADRRAAYLPLLDLAPLLAMRDITFVNLQYDDCRAELASAESLLGRRILGWNGLDLRNDFEETAALVTSLDLVIAPAISVAELAGALGVPVWRFANRDWTQLGTGVRPWYPSMRVFQPLRGQSLSTSVYRMAVELRRLLARVHGARPLPESVRPH